jgi:hypothetical protein
MLDGDRASGRSAELSVGVLGQAQFGLGDDRVVVDDVE